MGEDRTEGRTEGAQYITVGEAAQLLGVHRNTVRNRIKDGRIKAHKVIEGEREIYRIDANSLDVGRTSADVHNKVAHRTTSGGDVVQMLVHRIDQLMQDYNQQVGELREQLGEERGRRLRVEEENERLSQELEALREPRQSSEPQSAAPMDTDVGSKEGTAGPEHVSAEGRTNGPPEEVGETAIPQRNLFNALVPLPREYMWGPPAPGGGLSIVNVGNRTLIRYGSYAIGIVLTVAVSWLAARIKVSALGALAARVQIDELGPPPLDVIIQLLALRLGITVAFGIYVGIKDGKKPVWGRFNFIGALTGILSALVAAGLGGTGVPQLIGSYFLGTWLMFFSGVLLGKVVQYKAEQERWPTQTGLGFDTGSGRVTGQWGPRAIAIIGLVGVLGGALLQSMGQVIAALLGGGE